MTNAARHPLVEQYLRSLQAEAARLPYDQARELLADIDEHLEAALSGDPSEAEVRNVLERLGTPRELVSAAAGAATPAVVASKPFSSPGAAILCLVAAEVLAILLPLSIPLWIVGLVLLARATVWTEREKMLGFIGLGSGFPAALVFLFAATMVTTTCRSWSSSDGSSGSTCDGVDWVAVGSWIAILAFVALQVFTIWRLVRSARRR